MMLLVMLLVMLLLLLLLVTRRTIPLAFPPLSLSGFLSLLALLRGLVFPGPLPRGGGGGGHRGTCEIHGSVAMELAISENKSIEYVNDNEVDLCVGGLVTDG